MKNQYKFLMLFSAAVILLASCSPASKLAVTKRHYRSGYYVDRGVSKNKETSASQNKSAVHQQVALSESATKTTPLIHVQDQNELAVSTKTTAQKATKQATARVKNKAQTETANPVVNNAFANHAKANLSAPDMLVNPFYVSHLIKQNIQVPVDGDDGARSLLWLIIVIILILWLLGLLFSFGGSLIHLLLVLALILFILWLLRII